MCIIAVKPAKVKFSTKQLRTMWDSNPHGAGFMYAENNEVKIVKGLMTFDALVEALNKVGPSRKIVLHFRIKTHGAIKPENTHPFWVDKGNVAMVHNGVIRAVTGQTTDELSDTAVFAKKLGSAYVGLKTALHSKFHRDLWAAYIGQSKLVFMDDSGETFILNQHLGIWHKDVWYSNDSFRTPRNSKAATKPSESPEWWTEGKFERLPPSPNLSKPATEPATTVIRGSENKSAQKPLLGLPSTHESIVSQWKRSIM